MDSKTLIKALKVAVREVIKEELTEILREGLQSTINEMTHPVKKSTNTSARPQQREAVSTKKKPLFQDNKWASILNETDALSEQGPMAMILSCFAFNCCISSSLLSKSSIEVLSTL